MNRSPIIESYFIKIDTQGYEKMTIMGIKKIIEKCSPVILLEKGFSENEIMPMLSGYKIYSYDYQKNKFVKYETNSANVFLINESLTRCEEINKILKNLIEDNSAKKILKRFLRR